MLCFSAKISGNFSKILDAIERSSDAETLPLSAGYILYSSWLNLYVLLPYKSMLKDLNGDRTTFCKIVLSSSTGVNVPILLNSCVESQ